MADCNVDLQALTMMYTNVWTTPKISRVGKRWNLDFIFLYKEIRRIYLEPQKKPRGISCSKIEGYDGMLL